MHPSPHQAVRHRLRSLILLAWCAPVLAAGAEEDRAARKARCEKALAAHEAVLLEYYRAPEHTEHELEARLTEREAAVKRHCAGFDIVYRLHVRGEGPVDGQAGSDDRAPE